MSRLHAARVPEHRPVEAWIQSASPVQESVDLKVAEPLNHPQRAENHVEREVQRAKQVPFEEIVRPGVLRYPEGWIEAVASPEESSTVTDGAEMALPETLSTLYARHSLFRV